MSENNLILMTDAYKAGHGSMLLPNTTNMSSYFGPRVGSQDAEVNLFGLQYILKRYLEGPVVTREDISEAMSVWGALLGSKDHNLPMWNRVVDLGGYLPIRIKAWPEGTRVKAGFPMFDAEATDQACAPLVNHLEPVLSKTWYPSTVTTISGRVISALETLVRRSGGPEGSHVYMLHDFGYRSASSEETAAIGGAAHLVYGRGSDTMPALLFARKWYGAKLEGLASSVAASEHSIMTQGGRGREIEIAEQIIRTHPGQIVSLVCDSYNYYDFVKYMVNLRAWVEQLKVKLVLRPDSVTPEHPTPEALVRWTLQYMRDVAGTTTTQTGHLVTCYGVLWGDGLSPRKIIDVATQAVDDGFAAHNLVFGCGSGLLQRVDRDVERFAMKCSAVERDREWHDVKKDPLDASKISLAGRHQVVRHMGQNRLVDAKTWPADHYACQLKPVFENGVILRQYTFDEVRKNATV